ncbi:membrane-associated protein, putative [Bodo saltans]|uniref:Membrane-associated protein, putative n=1 Tax=Bodo saltans TaxID=75058 RepID=A0A0S4IXX1_BODSA|nr:membrane-associated protein, putative [Bodo saltans]|eukprot:CUG46956.1 membrane-associated protein, putative [Bodo saltans]
MMKVRSRMRFFGRSASIFFFFLSTVFVAKSYPFSGWYAPSSLLGVLLESVFHHTPRVRCVGDNFPNNSSPTSTFVVPLSASIHARQPLEILCWAVRPRPIQPCRSTSTPHRSLASAATSPGQTIRDERLSHDYETWLSSWPAPRAQDVESTPKSPSWDTSFLSSSVSDSSSVCSPLSLDSSLFFPFFLLFVLYLCHRSVSGRRFGTT